MHSATARVAHSRSVKAEQVERIDVVRPQRRVSGAGRGREARRCRAPRGPERRAEATVGATSVSGFTMVARTSVPAPTQVARARRPELLGRAAPSPEARLQFGYQRTVARSRRPEPIGSGASATVGSDLSSGTSAPATHDRRRELQFGRSAHVGENFGSRLDDGRPALQLRHQRTVARSRRPRTFWFGRLRRRRSEL